MAYKDEDNYNLEVTKINNCLNIGKTTTQNNVYRSERIQLECETYNNVLMKISFNIARLFFFWVKLRNEIICIISEKKTLLCQNIIKKCHKIGGTFVNLHKVLSSQIL